MDWVSMAEQLHPSLTSPSAMQSIGFSGVKRVATGLWSSGDMWGCFPGVGLCPIVPMKGTLNASAYQDILDNSMLPAVWGWLLPGQHNCTPIELKLS